MWEPWLQNGDWIHIRFQLDTWRFIFQRWSILRHQLFRREIHSFFPPQERNRIFTCLVICGLLKNCSETWRGLSSIQVTSAQGAMNWDLFFPIRFISDNCVYLKYQISKSPNSGSRGQSSGFQLRFHFSRHRDLVICILPSTLSSLLVLIQVCTSHFQKHW